MIEPATNHRAQTKVAARDLMLRRQANTRCAASGADSALVIPGGGTSKTPRRAGVPASPPFVRDKEDPIFTAIERHRAAMAAFSDAVDALAMLPPGPELDAANAITARKSDEMDNAGVDLITVQPTTFAGLAALLSHIVECSRWDEDWRLPGMVLFDSQTGRLRPAEFLEPRSEDFADLAMLAITDTIRRLEAERGFRCA